MSQSTGLSALQRLFQSKYQKTLVIILFEDNSLNEQIVDPMNMSEVTAVLKQAVQLRIGLKVF